MIGKTNAIQSAGGELYIVVSVTTGSTVTATKGAKTVTGTAASGSCTLIVPEAGTWSVTATLSGQTSNTKAVNVVDSYSVALSYMSSTLNNNGWDAISEVSNNGEGANYWAIGDRKAVTLDGTVGNFTFSSVGTYAFIIGFNHNASVEGSNRIHFQLAKSALTGGKDICLVDSTYNSQASATKYFSMNSSNTTSGGWSASQMRTNICGTSLSSYSGTIIAVIPAALRSALKSVTKYTNNKGGSSITASDITATTDYFFLLAEKEVFGSISSGSSLEGNKQEQYAYYSAGNSKIKYKHNATGNAAHWWLRSPLASGTSASQSFLAVHADGTVYANIASNSFGFAPGFCV